ncbi:MULTISPECIES: leucyl aminopeptidase [Hydrogenophaga]|uniref:Probable cytosol aminopeptidase n=1 Tax=Hydrogenophaga intermedia TaxID=65786 RepID=A0A1L1PEQ9_HYDIT|nr:MULTISPECIES: leucyl aminopeptidase [Hydrogenophaga]AOS79751.1 leucyl aminopeptidase [Hydrogenophaga sp. PBC]TMU77297.1 leucyl aminopeptidase [Hydrogenophaga intermedia]CDN87284.1 putative cytosol aminopeptidase [Hydrogenophaga intermedia]
MNFDLKTLSPAQAAEFPADALLVLVPETLPKGSSPLHTLAAQALKGDDLEPGVGKCLPCYRPEGIKAARVVLVRAGAADAVSVRKAVGMGMAQLKAPGIARLGVVFSLVAADAEGLRAALQICADASYVYTTTKPSAKPRALTKVTFGVSDASVLRAAFDTGKAVVAGVEFAKEWANRPANHATPSRLADAARQLGRLPGIKTEVLGPRQIEALGMGAFLAVAQGSAEPLRFIVMRYQGAGKADAPVVLVGKGITFDTGGISLKPAAEMDEMKFDMGGAASVLGTFAALAEARPAINVVGLIPTCENMPDGKAVKPGDVVRSMSGQTIEILNTDAEGRLILCDALTYAARFKPRAVIDIATLTGACVIALGAVRSGLFSPRDELAQALSQAGEQAGDPCWRLPLDDEYAEGLKSNFADVANVAGRAGGAVTAAKFLQRFATELPWAHLDIAGTAWRGGANKGATGRPVPLLLQYLLNEAQAPAGKARAKGKGSSAAAGR